MRRLEIWVDCESKNERDVRSKIVNALESVGVDFTMLTNSSEVVRKGSQK